MIAIQEDVESTHLPAYQPLSTYGSAIEGDIPSSSRNTIDILAPTQSLRTRKSTSWFSNLPFVSSSGSSAKRARQSVLSVVNDLVAPRGEEHRNAHQILASIAKICDEHKLSLSTILQETSIVDHTPMYWAVVNYREELLVALLVHSRPLSIQAISDIRRACLDSSNQGLFHELRTRRPPFHKTDGIQLPGPRTAPDNLLLGGRPSDEIHIAQTTDQGFVISFDIPLWQKRMKTIGQVGIEFIASGRMWSLIFFSADPILPTATSGKSRKGKTANTWHAMVSLLESSPPTYLDSQLIVDALPPSTPYLIEAPGPRESRSMTPSFSRHKQQQSQPSTYDYNSEEEAYSALSRDQNVLSPSEHEGFPSSSSSTLPPTHTHGGLFSSARLSTTTPVPISTHLGCGERKLGCRTGSGDSSKTLGIPTTKPNTWSDQGINYMNAAVTPLGEAFESQLLCGHSRYLLADGTLRARLEASFVKPESPKGCVIC